MQYSGDGDGSKCTFHFAVPVSITRSRPRSIQPEPKRLKTTNKKFESILYKEKWHAIKASKDFFKDSRNVVDLMLFKASEINTSVPLACDDELAFLVDTSKLEFDQDLTCDGTGKIQELQKIIPELS